MKEPKIENDQLIIDTLKVNGKEYIEIDDVLSWLKCLRNNLDKEWHPLLHYQAKAIVKMKNSKGITIKK